ncbi:uncharacterized protein LOC123201557 isoform X2 [Mangifera indica]|uniref:uncharacterized protein LOC123201557 isoform X2 n=1 Tax=Mangifera indica TaxID=29780 RepID=UPI001CFACE5F|nr:uncharacterized protein LOC123201557 isoform X2 [Mangifera indica]
MHFLYIFFFALVICAYILYNKWINVEDFDEMLKPHSSSGSGIGVGCIVEINFCSSSYRGHAVTMKHMLEASFPGIHVALGNHPPPLLKRVLSKIFSKLMEDRFPSEFEVRELVSTKLANLTVFGGNGREIWS